MGIDRTRTLHLQTLPPPQAANPSMQLFSINVFDCLAISFLLYLVVFRDHRRRGGLPYPPGPPSRPIIGNLLDFLKDMPWSAYAEMSKEYGKRVILANGTLALPNLNPHSKATLFVSALLLGSSSCCVHYHPLMISSLLEGKSTQIGPPCQSWKCTSCSSLLSNQPPC